MENLNRRDFLFLTASGAAAAFLPIAVCKGGLAGSGSTKQPNIIFIMAEDIGEKRDIAAEHPEIVAQIEEYLKTARTESPNWPV